MIVELISANIEMSTKFQLQKQKKTASIRRQSNSMAYITRNQFMVIKLNYKK